MPEIAPSLLSANFACLHEEIKKLESAGAKYLHFDIMDGHFVPNLTMGPIVVNALHEKTSCIFDIHLMLDNPDEFIRVFKEAGADIITVHYEACIHLNRVVNMIKELKIKAGVAINPATSPEVMDYILPELDMVLIMSVNPGFGGQKFIPNSIDKIRALKSMINKRKLDTKIEVDGGIDVKNIGNAVVAGADILVAGASVFGSNDPIKSFNELKTEMDKYM
ncbi:MAG: ribulose-phosphate 3-epimerase [Candidatus Firestonebacteria bacterium]|nr:ribulose-phosphate 3-epimerase [Candidatus Firestonebacteria bacterium]